MEDLGDEWEDAVVVVCGDGCGVEVGAEEESDVEVGD